MGGMGRLMRSIGHGVADLAVRRNPRDRQAARRGLLKPSIRMILGFALILMIVAVAATISPGERDDPRHQNLFDRQITANADGMLKEGRRVFRFETFGDEAFWTGTLG